jgi:hypothetical protein
MRCSGRSGFGCLTLKMRIIRNTGWSPAASLFALSPLYTTSASRSLASHGTKSIETQLLIPAGHLIASDFDATKTVLAFQRSKACLTPRLPATLSTTRRHTYHQLLPRTRLTAATAAHRLRRSSRCALRARRTASATGVPSSRCSRHIASTRRPSTS